MNLSSIKKNKLIHFRLRFILLIIVMGLYQSVSFTVQAQEQSNPKLTINSSESTIQKVLLKIEKASGYNFRYSEEISKDTRLFSFHFEEEEFLEILHTIANDTGLEFKRNGKNISVKFQERKSVKGKVTDVQTGESLIGVTVSIKGTTQGSVTDFEGNYSIMAKPSDQLQFSFVGYANQYFRVGNNSKIDVVLESETKGLDEIIVIGYGAQSKAKVTGAISKVKTVELNKYPSRSFDQQLSGKVAGVQVNEFSGQPGANAQIVIRGTGTITAGSSPLVVVDGVPLTEGSGLGFINTNDIESVDILKDAASASIYGSRGANGVILITTKKGKVGAPKFNLDMYFGWQKRSDNVEYADAYDAAQYFTEARDWGYVSKDPVNRNIEDDRATRISKGANKRELRLNYLAPYLNGEKGLTNTNWLDELYRTAPVQNYSLSVSGGTEKTDYFVSGNYLQQDGTLIETDYSRISSSIKINSQLSKRVKLSFSLNPSYSKQNFFNSGSWNDDPAAMAIIAYPFFTPYNDDGSLNISAQLNANAAEDGALGENPVAIARMLRNNKTTFRTYGNAQLSFELIQGLQFKTMFGGDFRNDFADYFNPSAVGKYRGPAPKTASAQERNTRVENIISENTINYKLKSKKHELDLIAGMTYQKENSTYTKVKGTDIADDNITNIQGAGSHTVQASRYRWTQLSYLARAQYFYQNRYQISAAFRRDGSSRFGDKSKWANFPSLALGWIISEESFFPKSQMLTMMKLRASWGKTGNNQIGSYSSKALIAPYEYVYGSEFAPGFSTQTAPNNNLSWETNSSYNFGMDINFFNKVNLSANYYKSTTSDLLLKVPVPQQSGYSTSLQNIGEVRNSGIEIELSSYNINLGPVKWNFNANLTTNENEVLSLAPEQKQIITGRYGAFRTKVGGPIAELYGYNVIGVYKTQGEINETPHLRGTMTGDYIVEDVNQDNVIDDKDKVGFGTNAPDFTYGISSSFSYNDFELSFALTGVEGRTVYDADIAAITEVGEGFGMPSKHYFENRYHPVNNPKGYFAQPNMGNFSSARRNTRASSMAFSNADYIRMRQLTFAYHFPKTFLQSSGISKARIYFTANNLFTITDYRGFNLESTSSNPLEAGYSNWGGYPVPKSYIIGINLSF